MTLSSDYILRGQDFISIEYVYCLHLFVLFSSGASQSHVSYLTARTFPLNSWLCSQAVKLIICDIIQMLQYIAIASQLFIMLYLINVNQTQSSPFSFTKNILGFLTV